MQWLIVAAIAYWLYTQGGLSALGLAPVPVKEIEIPLPGGTSVIVPAPEGWVSYRLRNGDLVTVPPHAPQAPGGWVQATYKGQRVWFNTRTGEMQTLKDTVIS